MNDSAIVVVESLMCFVLELRPYYQVRLTLNGQINDWHFDLLLSSI